MTTKEMTQNTKELHRVSAKAHDANTSYGKYTAKTQYFNSLRASIAEMKASGKYENYEQRQQRKQREAEANQ